ncbi:MAG TPA: metallophosphoesterase [Candidatus Dormibacteraeota bacterium]|nr:metallophosphoesterase [Candidatus Dormibacteraeota bacterium]
MTRILAVADEVDETLQGDKLQSLRPDVVLSCGDLPFDYLEYLVSMLDVPLLYVPGNHDPSLKPADLTWAPLRVEEPSPGPRGCESIDGRVIEAGTMRIAGLGGCVRYRRGVNQYTQGEMRRRALNLELRIRLKRVPPGRRRLDILVSHAPPFGMASAQDAAHAGFAAFEGLIRTFAPLLAVHGHVHPYGRSQPERTIGSTRILNVVPSRVIEI